MRLAGSSIAQSIRYMQKGAHAHMKLPRCLLHAASEADCPAFEFLYKATYAAICELGMCRKFYYAATVVFALWIVHSTAFDTRFVGISILM